MMSRAQRIEYEILNCALNPAAHGQGFATSASGLMERLRVLFPDIEPHEFCRACGGLARLHAITANFSVIGGNRRYRGADDDQALFDARRLWLKPAHYSRVFFQQLSALIEIPPEARRHFGGRPVPKDYVAGAGARCLA